MNRAIQEEEEEISSVWVGRLLRGLTVLLNESIYSWVSSVESRMIPHLLTLKDYWYLHPFPFSFLSLHTLFAPSVQSTFVQDPNIFADYTRLPLMAQPDYQNLSACLTEEFALFKNSLLAITNRALINSINELRNELHRTAAETRAHINETKREIETLRTDIMSRMEAR